MVLAGASACWSDLSALRSASRSASPIGALSGLHQRSDGQSDQCDHPRIEMSLPWFTSCSRSPRSCGPDERHRNLLHDYRDRELHSWAGFARIVRGMAASVRSRLATSKRRARWAPRDGELSRATSFLGARLRDRRRHAVDSGFYGWERARCRCVGLGSPGPLRRRGATCSRRRRTCRACALPVDSDSGGRTFFLAVMSFNFLGDHLRDHLDPSNAGAELQSAILEAGYLGNVQESAS